MMKTTDRAFKLLTFVSVLLLLASAIKLIFFPVVRENGTGTANRPTTAIEMIGDRQNIGVVPIDTVVTQNVLIINKGPETLFVEFVNPDCNCTGYVLSPADSACVGDTLSLALSIDMSKKKEGKFMLNTIVGMNTSDHLHRIVIDGEVTKN